MKSNKFYFILALLLIFTACDKKNNKVSNKDVKDTSKIQVHGQIKNGLREITVTRNDFKLRVFRGDYIILNPIETNSYQVKIPVLKTNKNYPVKAKEKKYIKMKKRGTYKLSVGPLKGTIEVIEYNEPNYKAISADEAEKIIKNISPLILDVRTTFEFSMGHIKNAILIPISRLESEIGKLEDYKNKDVLIYCATGNRSTVAAKILIDNGFNKIYNMRYGMADWNHSKKSIVK